MKYRWICIFLYFEWKSTFKLTTSLLKYTIALFTYWLFYS